MASLRHRASLLSTSQRSITLLRSTAKSQRRNVANKTSLLATPLPPPHSLLPTGMLLRSLLIATVSSHRTLLTPSLAVLSFFSKPRPSLFSVEKNPLLHAIFKSTLYRHFCAGENVGEVKTTIKNIKDMGFRGVILTYAREVVVDSSTEQEVGVGALEFKEKHAAELEKEAAFDEGIQAWRDGVLETASMLGEGDFLALKFTGAGAKVTEGLAARKSLPTQMQDALDAVCEQAIKRKASILVDAEQQFVQPGIDDVALNLMRTYNREHATVYNTYQAYLKSTSSTLLRHLHFAKDQGFTIGVKLVRGAYMATEPRHLINDTKQQTDDSYDSIAQGLLEGRYQDLEHGSSAGFPRLNLFLATHNKQSALNAYQVQQKRSEEGLPLIKVQYGQLLGMADEVSCTLLQLGDKAGHAAPEVYKCLSWGTLGDCISYLLRRAVENRDAVSRTKTEYFAVRREVWRRVKSALSFGIVSR
ncbi:hypothetical protein CDV36_002115 [Fusarium kuroshium]|uniref:Proline dehydrogenase n=1 Tax=Fusarium kuroshium TaxID=2010991 RepID=A0A3M2SKR8_9HYPO|nr:hypothetical protein CDV36_002115 [Fusarium kuroshium]